MRSLFLFLTSLALAYPAWTNPTKESPIEKRFTYSTNEMKLACENNVWEMCNQFGAAVVAIGNTKPYDLSAGAYALPYFKLACDHGILMGCTNMGFVYELGAEGLPPDISRSRESYEKGCNGSEIQKGLQLACDGLARLTPSKKD